MNNEEIIVELISNNILSDIYKSSSKLEKFKNSRERIENKYKNMPYNSNKNYLIFCSMIKPYLDEQLNKIKKFELSEDIANNIKRNLFEKLKSIAFSEIFSREIEFYPICNPFNGYKFYKYNELEDKWYSTSLYYDSDKNLGEVIDIPINNSFLLDYFDYKLGVVLNALNKKVNDLDKIVKQSKKLDRKLIDKINKVRLTFYPKDQKIINHVNSFTEYTYELNYLQLGCKLEINFKTEDINEEDVENIKYFVDEYYSDNGPLTYKDLDIFLNLEDTSKYIAKNLEKYVKF